MSSEFSPYFVLTVIVAPAEDTEVMSSTSGRGESALRAGR